MKIALLTASCRGGGAERVQISLAREFLQLGHCVYFVAFEEDGPLLREVPTGIHLITFGASRVMGGVLPLVGFLRKESPDVIIAAMAHVGTVAIMAQFLARWQGKLLVRVDFSRRYNSHSLFDIKRLVMSVLQKNLFPRAYAIVGVSQAIVEESQEDFSLNNCHLVHNPVATSFVGRVCSEKTHHPFFVCGEPIIIAIGRLSRVKGFSFLLKVFSVLRKSYNAKLIILGEGGERQNLEIEVRSLDLENHVSLPGFVPDPFLYLRNSSVYVLTSESESFGLSLVEALSTGMPIVSTDTEGPRDILNDEVLGELVPFGCIELFAAAICRALGTTEKYREIRITRAADFAPERIAAQYLRLIMGEE